MESTSYRKLVVVAAVALGVAGAAHAGPGEAYPGWGFLGSGRNVIAFDLGGNFADNAVDSAVGEDGSLYIAGTVIGPTGTPKMGIVKLGPDGGPDNTFSGDGRNTSVLDNVVATSMALGDTYIYVAGYTTDALPDSDMVVCRFVRASGVNASFVTEDDSICVTPDAFPTTQDVANDIILQPDGKFVIAGTMGLPGETYAAFARFDSSGQRDDSFGSPDDTSNLRLIRNQSLYQRHSILALARAGNGELAAVGSTRRVGHTADSALIIRLDEDGGGGTPEFVLDVDSSTSRTTALTDVATLDIVGESDQLVVAGYVELSDGKNSGLIAKVNSQLDELVPIFGEEAGYTALTEAQSLVFTNLALEPAGGIVALGTHPAGAALEVRRFDGVSGERDDFFGNAGKVSIDFDLPGNTHAAASIVVRGDAAYVTGSALRQLNSGNTDMVAAKLRIGNFLFRDGFESF